MKARDEKSAIESLRWIKRRISSIREEDLLEALARDDQPNNTRDQDTYHKLVNNICKAIVIAESHWGSAVNMMAYLSEDLSHRPGRQSSIVDCLRCKQPALGKIVAGLCEKCHDEWAAYARKNRDKSRADFLRDKIVVDQ